MLLSKKLFYDIPIAGYATIVVLILFIGGVQLFCLGVLGSYISKMYVQSKHRPVYILRDHRPATYEPRVCTHIDDEVDEKINEVTDDSQN